MNSSISSKTITLVGEGFCLQIEHGVDVDMITVTLNDFVKNEEKSTPDHTHYDQKDKVEVYLTPEELEEVIQALHQSAVRRDKK